MRWPRGRVAFLFTDVEGSTGLWERFPDRMPAAYARHDALLRDAVARHGGVVYKVIGDAFQVAFPDAPSAVAAALAAQRALTVEAWALPRPLRVRMALHLCPADPAPDGDYRTPGLNRLGRLLAAGHGGQVLVSAAVAAAVRDDLPADVALLDLGERRLKDLPGAERVYQLAAPGLLTDFPPLRTLDARPHDLPAPPSPLVGRAAEVAAIRDAIRDGGARLVTLTGPGGIGKTRLALAAAAALIDSFADGVRWVPLAGLAEPHLVVPAVAARLGVRDESGRPLAETLADWLRGRQLLLVLDNCEQIAEGVAEAAASWLERAPTVTILATSRGRLRLRAERVVAVGPLPLPPAGASALAEVWAAPAGELFLERAEAADEARPTDADAPVVARICALLDGLPLALELAAARLDRFTPADLLARLERRLPELADGPRDLPARQRTLRDTIAWSYDLLDPPQQAVFRRLSVLAGGGGRDAAAAICGQDDGDLDRQVSGLADHSLLRVETGDGEPRLLMLETIREFGRERLAAGGESADIERRHAAFFLAFAEEAAAGLVGAEHGRWLDLVARELDNLRAAMAWGLAGNDPVLSLRIAGALEWFWYDRGPYSEGLDWLDRSLAAAPEAPALARSDALRAAGLLRGVGADYATAQRLLEEAIAAAGAGGDAQRAAAAMQNLGDVTHEAGDFERAERLTRQAADAFRAAGNRPRLAASLGSLAYPTLELGRPAEALTIAREAERLATDCGDKTGIFRAVHVQAIALRRLGDVASADDRAAGCLRLAQEIKSDFGLGVALWIALAVAVDRGDRGRAGRFLGEALDLQQRLGDRYSVAELLVHAARLAVAMGDAPRSARLLGATAAIMAALGVATLTASIADLEQATAATRAALGQARFAELVAAGRGLPFEDALAEAQALATDARSPGNEAT